VEYLNIMEAGKKIVHWPPPVFIPFVTLVQLIVFATYYTTKQPLLKEQLQFHTDCISTVWWGYLTYSLMHVSPGHLIFNLALQLGVGMGLEMVHGTFSVMILYVLGVLSGSLAFFCFDCGAMLGASGGIDSPQINIEKETF